MGNFITGTYLEEDDVQARGATRFSLCIQPPFRVAAAWRAAILPASPLLSTVPVASSPPAQVAEKATGPDGRPYYVYEASGMKRGGC